MRSWRVDLTSEGNRRLDALAGAVAAERDAVFAGTTEDELATLRPVLDRVNKNLRRLLLRDG